MFINRTLVLAVVTAFSFFGIPHPNSLAADTTGRNFKQQEPVLLKQKTRADKDYVHKSAEGYEILIPAGYTYSISDDARVSLSAVKDADAAATPVFVVTVAEPGISIAEFMDQTTKIQRQRNATTKFDQVKEFKSGNAIIYKTGYSSMREQGSIKGFLAFCAKSERIFMLTIATRKELFSTNAVEIDRIVKSFRTVQ